MATETKKQQLISIITEVANYRESGLSFAAISKKVNEVHGFDIGAETIRVYFKSEIGLEEKSATKTQTTKKPVKKAHQKSVTKKANSTVKKTTTSKPEVIIKTAKIKSSSVKLNAEIPKAEVPVQTKKTETDYFNSGRSMKSGALIQDSKLTLIMKGAYYLIVAVGFLLYLKISL